ncbi:MAG: hypothetical protein ACXVJD_04995 [Mucilaginibacter sp.]
MSENFKPNPVKKIWLKLIDKEKYKQYKRYASHHKLTHKLVKFVEEGHDATIDEIVDRAKNDGEINVLHSGNAGDIIYSLPLIKKLFEITRKPINVLLKLNEPLKIADGYEHPLGAVMLNTNMAERLIPLLVAQDYLNDAVIFDDQNVHLDLTLFRKAGFALDKGNIARWNFFTTGITPDLATAWLSADPDKNFAGKIVLARSSRYNNALIDYGFLSNYKNVVFVGVKSEYQEMQKSIPGLKWQEVNDFLDLANLIAGCKLFIGNQSFPYAVAEGLKVKRLLEVYYQVPNVMPEGANGFDFCFQKHLEWLVAKLTNPES